MIKDQEIYNSIQSEARRQKEGLELIASENYVSSDVLEALGSILTNGSMLSGVRDGNGYAIITQVSF